MNVTFKGTPLELEGTPPALGVSGVDFALTAADGTVVTRQSLMGKKTLISTFPDITTRVCSIQSKKIIDTLGNDDTINLVNISINTYEESEAWCESQGVNALFLTDPAGAFGRVYGVYVPEKNFLARALIVLDEKGNVIHVDIVKELTDEPDYEAAYAVL